MSVAKPAYKKSAAAYKAAPKSAEAVLNVLRKLKESGGSGWWRPALSFGFDEVKEGKNNTGWGSLKYRDPSTGTKMANLTVNALGEVNMASIDPSTDEELAIAVQNAKPGFIPEKRTMKASLTFKKYTTTPKVLPDGKIEEPSKESASTYFELAALVNEAFEAEVRERIDNGTRLSEKLKAKKSTPKMTLAEFLQDLVRDPGMTIITDDIAQDVKRTWNVPAEHNDILKGCIIASSVKITSIVQEFYSKKSKKNAGQMMPNPATRVQMNFTGTTAVRVFDKTKPIGKNEFKEATVNGEKISDANVHNFINFGTVVDMSVDMSSICFSQMGISMPIKAILVVAERRERSEITVGSMYGEDEEEIATGDGGGDGAIVTDTTPDDELMKTLNNLKTN